MKKGDVIFFEGLAYKVTETPTEPKVEDGRVSRLGHFRAVGALGDKHPTVESHPKHLQRADPATIQEEIDAEMGQWTAGNAGEPDPKLRKVLQALTVANARIAGLEAGKLKGPFSYLPGRLVRPPVPRPAVMTLPRKRRA
jgi:hypothetical protein